MIKQKQNYWTNAAMRSKEIGIQIFVESKVYATYQHKKIYIQKKGQSSI